MRPEEATRPDDAELLRSVARRIRAGTGVGVVLAGLVDGTALTITELLGTRTDSLDRLWVRPGEGVGGGAIAARRPTAVTDYVAATEISHHHDEAVRREGLRAMVAAPVVVDGEIRAVVYAATRELTELGDRIGDVLVHGSRSIAGELRVRDEVDRRISILRGTEAPVAHLDPQMLATVREAYSDLLALAATTHDPEVSARLRSITNRLAGRERAEPDRAVPTLTRRETDVLAQVALGCTYGEAATRLGLRADTVKGYMQTVIAKLGVRSRHEAVATARRLGILP